jgi:cystathionine beta-lyase/cystathionine gamma-synthase
MDISTHCIHGRNEKTDKNGAVSFPIYQTATFAHPAVGISTGYDYSRLQNPTREELEKTVALLEGGKDAMAFSSGMAAISTLIELFSINDHIIVSDDTYGGSNRLFNHISKKNGIKFDFIDTSDIDYVEKHINENTKAIYVESPTNPMMHVTDIKKISRLAKKHSLLTIVDNTFLAPYFQQPIKLGADIVVHSGTKYLSGHNDTLAGFLVTASEELSDKLRFIYKTVGSCLSPFDSWLLMRGIKTLAVRMDKHNQNAAKVAEYLKTKGKIKKIYYAGFENHPGYQISIKQSSGFGGMLSFETDTKETAVRILEKVSLIKFAESLGGVESLITYPMLQTHADVPKEEREAKGINEKLLRLSVGIESCQDIIDDLEYAIGG